MHIIIYPSCCINYFLVFIVVNRITFSTWLVWIHLISLIFFRVWEYFISLFHHFVVCRNMSIPTIYFTCNPSAKELLYLSILLRATFIASTDSSAFLIVSAIAFFSLPLTTSFFNLSSTRPFSISVIF